MEIIFRLPSVFDRIPREPSLRLTLSFSESKAGLELALPFEELPPLVSCLEQSLDSDPGPEHSQELSFTESGTPPKELLWKSKDSALCWSWDDVAHQFQLTWCTSEEGGLALLFGPGQALRSFHEGLTRSLRHCEEFPPRDVSPWTSDAIPIVGEDLSPGLAWLEVKSAVFDPMEARIELVCETESQGNSWEFTEEECQELIAAFQVVNSNRGFPNSTPVEGQQFLLETRETDTFLKLPISFDASFRPIEWYSLLLPPESMEALKGQAEKALSNAQNSQVHLFQEPEPAFQEVFRIANSPAS